MSKGPEPVPVPNVAGLTQSVAATVLAAADLTVGTVTEQYSATVPSGVVISQTPATETGALPGSSVALVVSKGPQPVTVPNVVGQTQASASAALTGAGLAVGTVTEQYSATVPSGAVCQSNPRSRCRGASRQFRGAGNLQRPAAGNGSKSGGTAAVLRHGGDNGCGTDCWDDHAALQCRSAFGKRHFAAAGRRHNGTARCGGGFGGQRQPCPGRCGPTSRACPWNRPRPSIIAAGLAAGTVTMQYSTTVPNNRVISQNPNAGDLADPGTPVGIVVSQGVAAQVTVPNVTGLSRTQAETAITGAGLVLGTVSELYNAVLPADDVMYQDPSAGARVAAGTAVVLAVSRGPQPVSVPDLSILSAEEAQTAPCRCRPRVGFRDRGGPVTRFPQDRLFARIPPPALRSRRAPQSI